jgi:hypothetical protein
MMEPIQIRSEVGSDGILSLQVPMGEERAHMEVVVTIAGIDQANKRPLLVDDWHGFVTQTYGSCAGLGLVEPREFGIVEGLSLEDWEA